MGFMDGLKKTLDGEFNQSFTENGALGLRTTGRCLLDLSFAVSSLRNAEKEEITDRFAKAYYEEPRLAVKWLFYASDVREGLGERRLFRTVLAYLAHNQPELAKAVLPLIPEYNRWDQVLLFLDTCLANSAVSMIQRQLEEDLRHMEKGAGVSLCAKWMPSVNASSEETRRLGRKLAGALGLTERQYRKRLSALRASIKVVETIISQNDWGAVDYEAVPSRANLIYGRAFLRHDEERRRNYLGTVKRGEAAIHAGVLYPHDIVHRYFEPDQRYRCLLLKPLDDTLEALWKALPDYVGNAGDTLCVSDGSASMTSTVGGTDVSCLDVANALSIYFSEHCGGQFRDRYITFSANPQFVDFSNAHSLREKIEIARRYDEVANTNIEAVFDLILETARKGGMTQEDMPANILILSDMEFDMAARYSSDRSKAGRGEKKPDEKLFDTIARRYAACGYRLPRLVFWNLCSRTGTIPLKENKLGVALISGFSVTTMKMVLSGETDPYRCLVRQLELPRYDAVDQAIAGILARS